MAEFTFTDEQNQLRAAVRKFCAENFDEQTVRRLMESDPPFDPKVWARLGAELGVLGLSVPEADGGVGGTLVDQAVAVEELGASLACGPVFGTVFLAIPALVAASAGQARDELLAELVEGRRTAAFAVADRAGAFAATVSVTADGDALTGTVERVVDAGAADDLLVAARSADGVALYAVDAAGPGSAAHPAGHARPDPAAGHRPVVRARPAGWWPVPVKPNGSSSTRCRWVRRCWPSSRSAPDSICSTCRSTTRSRGCSSAGRSARSRRSSTGWRTCSSTSSTPAPRPTTRCGHWRTARMIRRWR